MLSFLPQSRACRVVHAEFCTQVLHALDLEIYDKALARVGEVTPDIFRIEELVTSELSLSPARPAPGSAGAAGRRDTPASSTSPRLAATSPSTKRGKQREGRGPAAVDKRRRKDRKTQKSEEADTPKKDDTKDLGWLRKRD